MKPSFLLFLGLIPCLLFAQFQRDYVQAEIQFKNGENLKGWIYDDFAQNNWYGKSDAKKTNVINGGQASGSGGYYSTTNFNNSATSTFQTIIKKIQYKVNKDDGQKLDYSSDSIEYVITTQPNGKITKYKTFQLVRADHRDDLNVKFDTVNRTMWSPVLKEGKINMYGYFNWLGVKNNSWSDVYFQKENEPYAVQILLSHKVVWGLKSHRNLIKAALIKVFGDCLHITENIEDLVDQYIIDFKHTRSGLSSAQKSEIKALPKNLRDQREFEIREERSFIPYLNLYNLYMQHCGK